MRSLGPEPVKIAYNMSRASLPKVAAPFVNALFCQETIPSGLSTQAWSRLDALRISTTPNLTYGTLCLTEIS